MAKRLRGVALQKYNEKRRREAEAAEAANQNRLASGDGQPDPPVKTAAELLAECAEKQKKYIEDANNVLPIWRDRFSRLVLYSDFLDKAGGRRFNLEKLEDQVKKAEAEYEALERKEVQLWDSINTMKAQETRLEKVFQEVNKHHKCQSNLPDKDGVQTIMPNQNEIQSVLNAFPTLNNLLRNTHVEDLPNFLPEDLDEIQWPILSIEAYRQHFNEETDLAKECLERDKEIEEMRLWLEKRIYQDYQAMKNRIKHLHENPQIHGELVKAQQDAIKAEYLKWESLVKKVHIRKASIATIKQEEDRLSTLQASRDAHLETLRELVNEEMYKCEMCLQLMTNGDSSTKCPKIFGSCGHTVCSECMPQFKIGNGWRCPECRTFSSQICTNWELMRKINPAWQPGM